MKLTTKLQSFSAACATTRTGAHHYIQTINLLPHNNLCSTTFLQQLHMPLADPIGVYPERAPRVLRNLSAGPRLGYQSTHHFILVSTVHMPSMVFRTYILSYAPPSFYQ